MFGRAPGLVRFIGDPHVWSEFRRLTGVINERFPATAKLKVSVEPARLVWRLLTMHKLVRHDGAYLINSFLPPFPSPAFETLALRNVRAIEYGLQKALVVPPMSSNLAITNACPLNCWHCSKARRPGQRDIAAEQWLKVIAELQDWGVAIIAFTGGEPLAHAQLERLIASVDERSTTYIFTSGVGLDAERARSLKKAGLYGVIVSLDHYEEAVHDRMRSYPGAYQAALTALCEARAGGMYTMLQVVATKGLLRSDGLTRLCDIAKATGTLEVRVLPPIPTGALLDAGSDVLLTQEERTQIAEFDRRSNGRLNYPRVSSYIRVEGPELFGCGAGTQHSYIDASGNVYPCDFVPLSFGNIQERSFRDIWCEVAQTVKGPRCTCFMAEHHTIIRALANGVLPLTPTAAMTVCSDCQPTEAPDFYRMFKQVWN
jgi:MoaA/NifB/PqqE/SkfB family radical SAM enzyme